MYFGVFFLLLKPMAKRPKKAADTNEDDGWSREEYFAERNLLITARQRSFQRAEQMVAGGATGALLLSVTFLEKLAPGTRPVQYAFLLVVGWAVLLASLCASLFGQYASGWSFSCEIENLNAEVNNGKPKRNRWNTCNTYCAFTSSILLVAGIALLAVFAYMNAPFRP